VTGPVQDRERQRLAVQLAVDLVGVPIGPGEHGPRRQRAEQPVAQASHRTAERGQPHAVGSGVAAGDREREDTADDDGRALSESAPQQEGATGVRRFDEQHVRRLLRLEGHDRVVLGAARAHEDVLEVEGDGLRTLEGGPLREDLLPVLPVVEVGLGGQGDVFGAGGRYGVGEPGAGDEAHPVPALGEVAGLGQERCDVPVDRDGGDDDRRHGCDLGSGTPTIGYHVVLLTPMR
jgi:hypothetical protein